MYCLLTEFRRLYTQPDKVVFMSSEDKVDNIEKAIIQIAGTMELLRQNITHLDETDGDHELRLRTQEQRTCPHPEVVAKMQKMEIKVYGMGIIILILSFKVLGWIPPIF